MKTKIVSGIIITSLAIIICLAISRKYFGRPSRQTNQLQNNKIIITDDRVLSDPEFGFSLKYPSSKFPVMVGSPSLSGTEGEWRLSSVDPRSPEYPESLKHSVIIGVVIKPYEYGYEKYLSDYQTVLKNAQVEKVVINNTVGYAFNINQLNSGKVVGKHLIFINNHKLFNFVFETENPEVWQKEQNLCDQIISTITFSK